MKVGVVVYTLFTLVNASIARNNYHRKLRPQPKAPVEDPSERIADETINLINRGYQEIPFNNTFQNVVLMVGNTGAGKTTLSKFITGQPLVSYRKAGRNIIKDAEDKISQGATLVSKTIFPDMFVDEDTNTAYFDLPGFSDTRNASIELANSWFMKMVADHVDKVKIIFIVTHSSLRSGESRTDFKGLLEHATSFILNPSKFQSAIALVASKVDSYTPDEVIVPDIAEFLETETEGIRSIFEADEEKLQRVLDLIDAFLAKGPSGDYERIGFFKQPAKVGPLSDMPEMKVRRAALKDIIDNRLQYVRKDQDDFGISVSDNARYYVRVIVEKLNSKFTGVMTKLSSAIQQHYQQQLSSNSPVQSFLGKFIREIAHLETITHNLTRAYSRLGFIEILEKQTLPLSSYNSTLTELRSLHKNMEFYEKIDTKSIAPDSLEWAQPLRTTVNQLKVQASKFLMALNTKVEAYATEIVNSLETMYEKTVQDGINAYHSTQKSITKSFAKDLQLLGLLKNDLPKQLTFNSFWNVARNSLSTLSVKSGKTTSSQSPLLADDIVLQTHPELKSDAWIRTMDLLLTSVISKQSEFIRNIQEKKHEAGIKALNSNITNLIQHNSEISKIAKISERRLNESIIQQKKITLQTENKLKQLVEKEAKLREQLLKEKKELEDKVRRDEEKNKKEALAREEARFREFREDQKRRDEEARNREKTLELQIQKINSEAQVRREELEHEREYRDRLLKCNPFKMLFASC